MADKQMKEM